MRVLIITNGMGEDAMGAALAKALAPQCEMEALPTVGEGLAYRNICPLVGPRGHLASEGHRKQGSLIKDFQHGLALTALKHVRYMRQQRGRWDKIIVLGDMVGLALCKAGGHAVDLYLDCYKSGFASTYSAVEKRLIKATAAKTLCRDDILAGQLRAYGLDAGFVGNIMMDTVPELAMDVTPLVGDKTAVTLLPGSRNAAKVLFELQIRALGRLTGKYPISVLVPVAPTADANQLIRVSGLRAVDKEPDLTAPEYLAKAEMVDKTPVHFFDKGVGSLARVSRFVAGQAGTAGFQSAGLGVPVIALVPPDARPSRVAKNERLMGESRITTSLDVNELTAAMASLLEDEADAKRRGHIGMERIGPAGALDYAVRLILAGG
ncbi:hypothetical protein [Maritalea mediterranea]|uniref:Lipid-A-disaccharide synthase n=1 Tax=Maritalea mediterranea TaxID=2909667 RepID=A0ABS9E4K3_9HYPH|nr:hypothetical protein [Maritalea mediterranea]MCF4097781.1 hypothetical protein [Maritalea mediterranea]